MNRHTNGDTKNKGEKNVNHHRVLFIIISAQYRVATIQTVLVFMKSLGQHAQNNKCRQYDWRKIHIG
jgi:hypothetical protein